MKKDDILSKIEDTLEDITGEVIILRRVIVESISEDGKIYNVDFIINEKEGHAIINENYEVVSYEIELL